MPVSKKKQSNPTFLIPRLLLVFGQHKDKWFTRKELSVLIGSRNYDKVGMHLGILETEGKIVSKADDGVPFFRKIYRHNGGD